MTRYSLIGYVGHVTLYYDLFYFGVRCLKLNLKMKLFWCNCGTWRDQVTRKKKPSVVIVDIDRERNVATSSLMFKTRAVVEDEVDGFQATPTV